MLLSGIENKIETILLFIEGFICLILFIKNIDCYIFIYLTL